MGNLNRLAAAAALSLLAVPAAAQPSLVRGVPLAADSTPSGAPADFCRPLLTGRGPPPVWTIVNDASAMQGRAVTEATRDRNDNRIALCLTNAPALRNVDVTVRFRPIGGRIDQSGGIAVRVIDENHYYLVRASPLDNTVRLLRVVGGVAAQIGAREVSVTQGDWHSLRLRATSERFEVFLDSARLFEALDGTINLPGRIALATRSDGATHFETLAVIALD